MRAFLFGLAILALAGCVGTPTAQQQTLTQAGATLATALAAKNTSVATAVTRGQLFCSGTSGLFALLNATSNPTSIIGVGYDLVVKACQVVDSTSVPVPPPVQAPGGAGAVPVIVAPMVILPSQAAI